MNSKEQPVRLFVDAHVFDGEYQGTRTFIREIYTIIASKPGITLYLGANDTDNLKKYFPQQDNIVFVQYRNSSRIVRLASVIPSIIKKYGIQYAHFQYIVPLVKNCRFINTVHDVLFNEYPGEFSRSYRLSKNWLFRLSALRSDILTTVSEYSKESIRKHLRINTGDIIVTPNGVAPKFFAAYDRQQSKNYIKNKYGFDKYILFVSRLEPRKNHLLLLNAWLERQLYARGYHLVLLGHKSIPIPGFDEAMAGLPANIRPYVFLHNNIDDNDLLEFYRAADLFVYPSKAEGFGIPPLEAAALGIPVICSNTSAMSDFTFFGATHIDPNDHDVFVRTLEETLSHPPDDAYLKKIAAIVQQKYNWRHSAEKLYQRIMNDKDRMAEDKKKRKR